MFLFKKCLATCSTFRAHVVLKVKHTSQARAFVKEVEPIVDGVKRHAVRNVPIQRDLALEVSLNQARHLDARLPATKGRSCFE